MRIETDDDVRRIHAVWLGPDEYTFPFHARYQAWVTWFGLFCLSLVVLWLTPATVNINTMIWAISATVVATTAVLAAVDYEKPLWSVAATFWRESTGRRSGADVPRVTAPDTRRVRIRTTGGNT